MHAVLRTLSRGAALGGAVLALLVLASCGTQENYQLGVAFLEDAGRGVELVQLELSRAEDYEFAAPAKFPGVVGTMLVGSRPGFLARGVMRFAVDSLAVETVVDSAFVDLIFKDGLGDRGSLALEIYKITSVWPEGDEEPNDTGETLTFPTLETVVRLAVDVPFAASTTDTLRLSLTALVQEWVTDPTTNFGFALVPAAAQDSEIEFSAREGGDPPQLLIYTNDGTDVVLTALSPSADSFVLETTVDHVSPVGFADRLTLARGVPARVLMDFDIPDFGERVTIHRAEVTVHVDPASSVTHGFSAGIQRVISEPWVGEATEVDLLLHGVTNLPASADSVVLTVTAIVRQMLDDENFGMQLRALEERQDTEHLRLFGPGTLMPPSLRIWFTTGAGDDS